MYNTLVTQTQNIRGIFNCVWRPRVLKMKDAKLHSLRGQHARIHRKHHRLLQCRSQRHIDSTSTLPTRAEEPPSQPQQASVECGVVWFDGHLRPYLWPCAQLRATYKQRNERICSRYTDFPHTVPLRKPKAKPRIKKKKKKAEPERKHIIAWSFFGRLANSQTTCRRPFPRLASTICRSPANTRAGLVLFRHSDGGPDESESVAALAALCAERCPSDGFVMITADTTNT